MHLIKKDEYYLAFNKKVAIEVLGFLKPKRLCVIDFEAFQFHKWTKEKFDKITINDIPYTVCLNTLIYDNNLNMFVSENEIVYQFCDDWSNQNELLLKLEEFAIFIANYVKENNIEKFLYMAKFLEIKALEFFVETFSSLSNLKDYLLLKGYELYDYFFNANNFKIISYKYKPQHIIKDLMNDYGDEYENFEIGKDGMKHFEKIVKGKPADDLNFDLVKKHSLNDLKKGIDLINYINQLANFDDNQVVNILQLQKEENQEN
ncbi:hypothetical protein SGLAD_v1c06690 [Spiroplasma gladiatoris]|uniref:Uncharacterized protein n=1 Tax=Spiroplasma gladiatoris TaxID=2143 RepID=A0A4P7AJ97_9MOLU|nr:hypothetical protein [Spiroplasma gladiatoris]QBQ07868.1 hypothetical protein SGLAD_v1c06690 [Spiroplasma gladiatoris]